MRRLIAGALLVGLAVAAAGATDYHSAGLRLVRSEWLAAAGPRTAVQETRPQGAVMVTCAGQLVTASPRHSARNAGATYAPFALAPHSQNGTSPGRAG